MRKAPVFAPSAQSASCTAMLTSGWFAAVKFTPPAFGPTVTLALAAGVSVKP